jgi:hypothetical protein
VQHTAGAEATLTRDVTTQPAPSPYHSVTSPVTSRGSRYSLAAVAVLAAAVAQLPALDHFFRTDDFLHFFEIVDHGFARFALNIHGGHLLFTSNSVFYFWHALFGLTPAPYNALAFATHLVNVFLLFRVVEISADRSDLALAAALAWGTSGVNLGSVGWFSVYGHVLVATWTLWILYDVARIGQGRKRLSRTTLIRWYVLLLASATSFGTGIPIAMTFGAVVVLLLPDGPDRRRAAIALGSLVVVIPCVYLAFQLANAEYASSSISDSPVRFMLGQLRRVSGWISILSMLSGLVAYGTTSLLAGPVLTSGLEGVVFGPLAGAAPGSVLLAAFVLASAALAAVLAVARRAPPALRRRLLAYAILVVACYAMIAIGRSIFHRVEFAVAARYHYVAPAIVALLLASAAAEVRVRRRNAAIAATAAWLVAIVALAPFANRRLADVITPPDGLEAYTEAVAEIEDAIRSRPAGSVVRVENHPFPVGFGNEQNFPGWAALFVIRYSQNEVDGRTVRFVERDAERLAFARRTGGARINELLVGPDE